MLIHHQWDPGKNNAVLLWVTQLCSKFLWNNNTKRDWTLWARTLLSSHMIGDTSWISTELSYVNGTVLMWYDIHYGDAGDFMLTFICLILWTFYYLLLDCLGSGWGFTWSLQSLDPHRSCQQVWQTLQELILTLLCPAWVFVRNSKYSHPMLKLAIVTTCHAKPVIKLG